MKRKISLLLGLLVMVLSFTGCAKTEEPIEYDEAAVGQMIDFLIQYSESVDEASLEEWNNLSEYSQNYQFMQSGLRFTPESFSSAIESWKAGVEECGAYVGHGDLKYTAAEDGLEVSTHVEYENREADVVFEFDEKLYLESVNVNAEFSTGEILKKAGLNTLLGMGTVFSVLIFISIVISLFKFIPSGSQKKAAQAAPVKAEAEAAPAVEEVAEEADDLELIAVISAAIAAAEGTSTDGFVVRSIRRRQANRWNS
ncbi:sodium pump decarboxylase, gamma subunit [Dorea sp. 5-2]|nr:sodium pump decarboxylase, gamma subunit [Dorea sp. 5-2]